jgi:hypothetical protein
MKFTFTKKSFEKMQKLSEDIKNILGHRSYAETTYASMVVEYSTEFQAMLRPYPPQEIYEFEMKAFQCKTCKKPIWVIAASTTVYEMCDECRTKQLSKAKK